MADHYVPSHGPSDRKRQRSHQGDLEAPRESSSHRHRPRGSNSNRPSKSQKHERDGHTEQEKKWSKWFHRHEMRSEDEEELLDLEELGVEPITEDDYYLRSIEYRYWLKEERGRYLDELSSVDAHKYFRRFVRRWNDGALKERYYHPPEGSSSTRHQWSFSTKDGKITSSSSARPADIPRRSAHRSPSPGPPAPRSITAQASSDADEIGPTLPSSRPTPKSTADRQLLAEDLALARKAERKAVAAERYRRADEAVPRASGKEGKMEEKRATNASNKEMRDKDSSGAAGLEVDEGVLMGDQGGFAAALRARDGAKNRREEAKAAMIEDKRIADQERMAERRQKESDTMSMLKAMAKERFG